MGCSSNSSKMVTAVRTSRNRVAMTDVCTVPTAKDEQFLFQASNTDGALQELGVMAWLFLCNTVAVVGAFGVVGHATVQAMQARKPHVPGAEGAERSDRRLLGQLPGMEGLRGELTSFEGWRLLCFCCLDDGEIRGESRRARLRR